MTKYSIKNGLIETNYCAHSLLFWVGAEEESFPTLCYLGLESMASRILRVLYLLQLTRFSFRFLYGIIVGEIISIKFGFALVLEKI